MSLLVVEQRCEDLADYISELKRQQGFNKIESVNKWMEDNEIPKQTQLKVKQSILCRLGDDVQDVNVVSLLSVLPYEERTIVKTHLYKPFLDKLVSL